MKATYEEKQELEVVFQRDFYRTRIRDVGKETEKFDVKACVSFLPGAIRKAAKEYDMNETDATRLALDIGIGNLFRFPYVESLDSIWNDISDTPGGDRYLESLEGDSFNFKDDKKVRLNRWVKSETMAQCGAFSKKVGLNLSDVIQLALMAGLLKAEKIPIHYRQLMFDYLSRFLVWLENKFDRAKRVKAWCMEGAKTQMAKNINSEPPQDYITLLCDKIECMKKKSIS